MSLDVGRVDLNLSLMQDVGNSVIVSWAAVARGGASCAVTATVTWTSSSSSWEVERSDLLVKMEVA